jgi:hypothetical protein
MEVIRSSETSFNTRPHSATSQKTTFFIIVVLMGNLPEGPEENPALGATVVATGIQTEHLGNRVLERYR